MKRNVKKLENGKWIDDEFKNLKVDDIVKMFEPDNGDAVTDEHDHNIFKVVTIPKIMHSDVYGCEMIWHDMAG